MRAFAMKFGAALGLSLLSAGVLAGTYTQNPDPASVAQGASVQVDFLFAGDGVTEDTQLDLNYNTTVFPTVTGAPTPVTGTGSICAVFSGPGFIRIVPPSGGGIPLTNTATSYCRFNFTAAAGATPGNYDFTQRFIECAPGMAACTRTGTFRITVTGGGGGGTAPTVTYNPTAGTTINFPAGAAGNATSSVAVTSAGGTAPGTVTVNNCSATGGFTITNAPINLTGTAGGAQINSSINLQCTRGGAVQNGTLTCTETPTPGAAVTRSWPLVCPAATVADVPPTLIYQPAPGNVTISGAVGASVTQTLDVSCNGVAGGSGNCTGSGAGTARLQNVTVTGFSPSSLTCGFFTEGGAAAASPLNFVAGGADPGDIRCTCLIPSVNQSYIVSATEIPNTATPGTTVLRSWNVTCGAGQVCGTISANPASGTVTLNNGGGATLVTTVTTAGSGAAISRTVNCALSGVNGATFNVTTSPSPLTIVGNGTGTVSATCTNSNVAAGTATLTCTSTSSDPQCPTLSATYTLSCPGVQTPPSVTTVPVPALGEQGRILLAALMLALGLVIVGFRLRG